MPHGLSTYEDRTAWLKFRNDSGEVIPPFALLRITGLTLIQNQRVLTVNKPNDTFNRYYAVNGGAKVGIAKLGECTMSRVCLVRTEAGAGLGTYGARSGQWGLEPSRPGFTSIATHGRSSQPNVVLAMQEPVSTLFGKTDAIITNDSSGTVSVHFSGSANPSEYNVSASLHWMNNGESVGASKEVMLQWIDGLWKITGAECEAEA